MVEKKSWKKHQEETKRVACKIFLEKGSVRDTYLELCKLYNPAPNKHTVHHWHDEQEWDKLLQETKSKEIVKVEEQISDIMADRTVEHVEMYREIQEKGRSGVATTSAKNLREAMEAVDRGIKGEREIQILHWAKKYAVEVLQVVRKYVNDDTYRKVEQDLYLVYRSYREQGL